MDPHRPGHEMTYYPGETNVRKADVIVINKIETADPDDVAEVRENCREVNPQRYDHRGRQPDRCGTTPPSSWASAFWSSRNGPTLTHGEMTYRCRHGSPPSVSSASEAADPRPWAVDTIAENLRQVSRHRRVAARLWVTNDKQVADLEKTHQRRRLRQRDHRYSHRPASHRQDRQACRSRELQSAGDRASLPWRTRWPLSFK